MVDTVVRKVRVSCHYIWRYRQKLSFKQVEGLKFNSVQLFDVTLYNLTLNSGIVEENHPLLTP